MSFDISDDEKEENNVCISKEGDGKNYNKYYIINIE